MFEKFLNRKEVIKNPQDKLVAAMTAVTMFLAPFAGNAQEHTKSESLETQKMKNQEIYKEYAKKHSAETWLSVNNKAGRAVFGSSDENNRFWLQFEATPDTTVGADGKKYLEGTVIHFNDDNKDGQVDEATVVSSKKVLEDINSGGYYKTPLGKNVNTLKVDSHPDMEQVQAKYTQLIAAAVEHGEIVEH